MKKYAEIKDDVIVNISVFSDDSNIPENHIEVTGIRCGKGDHVIDGQVILKPSKYHTWNGSEYEITEENQSLKNHDESKRVNSLAKRNLDNIDKKSIRSIREFIIAKFGDDPLMSEFLKTHESDSKVERDKIIE